MDDKVKEKLQKLIESKKKGGAKPYPSDSRDLYLANGERRKGVKQHKQGGLFDK